MFPTLALNQTAATFLALFFLLASAAFLFASLICFARFARHRRAHRTDLARGSWLFFFASLAFIAFMICRAQLM